MGAVPYDGSLIGGDGHRDGVGEVVGGPSSVMGDRRVRIIGAGRAGGAFALALGEVGWRPELLLRGVPLSAVAHDVELVLVCVPDVAVREVAAEIEPDDRCVVAHCAGSLTLDVLDGHVHRASVHPLVSLPSPPIGARRLRSATFGVAGDAIGLSLVRSLVGDLGGRCVEPDESRRVEYHAAAVIASNHLVALLGQVQRVAARAGVPMEAYLDLASGTVQNVGEVGPAAALTGPVARGDWATVAAHLAALDPDERDTYLALARETARLAGRDLPDL